MEDDFSAQAQRFGEPQLLHCAIEIGVCGVVFCRLNVAVTYLRFKP